MGTLLMHTVCAIVFYFEFFSGVVWYGFEQVEKYFMRDVGQEFRREEGNLCFSTCFHDLFLKFSAPVGFSQDFLSTWSTARVILIIFETEKRTLVCAYGTEALRQTHDNKSQGQAAKRYKHVTVYKQARQKLSGPLLSHNALTWVGSIKHHKVRQVYQPLRSVIFVFPNLLTRRSRDP